MRFIIAILLSSCWPEFKAYGIRYQQDESSWKPQVDALIEIQAALWNDPGWVDFVKIRLTVNIKLVDEQFNCGDKMADGCTYAMGGFSPGSGFLDFKLNKPIWLFDIVLVRHTSPKDTAIGYELGHVYLQSHGMTDDDSYSGMFWSETQAAIDKWRE